MKKTKGKLIFSVLLTLVLVMAFCVTACGNDTDPPVTEHKHVLQKVAAVAPTCTDTGSIEYWKCTADGCTSDTKNFSDSQGANEIKNGASITVAKKGHTLEKMDAAGATCTQTGNSEYWKCSDCGSLFADSEGKTATEDEDVEIPATGHTPAAEWTNDIYYHWKDCTFGHTIEQDKDYHDLSVTLSGGKREYLRYEPLDVSGMTADLECSVCGFDDTVTVTEAMVSGYDKSVTGNQTLTVTYRAKTTDPETEVTATYLVNVSEAAISYSVTLENAWFGDDSSEKEMEYNTALPGTVKFVNGKTHIGWYDRASNKYFETDGFKVTGEVTLTAVYNEDLATPFTPSCVLESMTTPAQQTTMTHETIDGIKATKFVIPGGVTANAGYKILNNAGTRPDNCQNVFPIYKDRGSLVMMTFINNGAEDLEIKYQAEYHGIKGEVVVTVPAGQTVQAALPCGNSGANNPSNAAFNQIYFNQAVDGEVSLTIFGRIYTYTDYSEQLNSHLLTLYGATFASGETSEYYAFEADALDGVILNENKTFLGWANEIGTFCRTDDFVMPATDATLYAVYDEDVTTPFTPSCALEKIGESSNKPTMGHETVDGIKATKIVFDGGVTAGVGYKILNGAGTRPDSCGNYFPVYSDRNSFALMTFINNGADDLEIKYQAEYFGIRGEIIVTVPAGQTIDEVLPYSMAEGRSPTNAAFSQIYFNQAVEGEVSLTVYGRIYDPEYYEKAAPHSLTFVGATYDGGTSASLVYGQTLTGEIETEGDKTPMAWVTASGVYETTDELIAEFEMGHTDGVITAIYEDTIDTAEMQLFTPSCVYKDKSLTDANKKQGTHNADGSTTYIIDTSVASWMIYNGTDENNKNDGNTNSDSPASIGSKRLYYFTLTNSGDIGLTIQIGPENFGLRNPKTVTVPAGETVNMFMFVYGFNAKSTFWQFNNLAPVAGETTLSIVGYYI